MTKPDRRLNAYRPDLADSALRGKVDAAAFTEGFTQRVIVPVCDLRGKPEPMSGPQSQILYGDEVTVFEQAHGWSWVQAKRDGYVGYIADSELGDTGSAPTHRICVPRTFIYSGADLRFRHTSVLSLGSVVSITEFKENRGSRYGMLADGTAIFAKHLRAIDETVTDYVSTAESLLNTPYLWGGTSGLGIDCSGLVQLAMLDAGRDVLRDSDMQGDHLGEVIDAGKDYADLQRGDLVFWPGHVAIMTDAKTMIHANGHTMTVSYEDLREGIDRIAYLYDLPSHFRRP
ncbi:NlpC/P60 family protein [Pseudochrobactrum sp. MP213Fo]|uniref:C40 family peptidase n=1 Tax=Pseudochrobactrum sp. MP213Fo TaxID=3022250 RepID=UPI003BA33328